MRAILTLLFFATLGLAQTPLPAPIAGGPGSGSGPCTISGSATSGYVLTATSPGASPTCDWETVGGASVSANTVKNAIFLTDGGTANLVSGTTTTAFPGAYAIGQCVAFVANATNAAASQINIDSLGPVGLTKFGATALAAGNKVSGTEYLACYNGTQFQVLNPTLIAADVPTLNQDTTGKASNVSGTPALPNGTTATTQSQGDGTTKIATDAYVDTGLGTKVATSKTCNLTSSANPVFDTTTCNGTPGSYTYWKMVVNASVASLTISNLVDSVPYAIKLVHDGTGTQYTIAAASNLTGMPFFPSNVANEYVVFAFAYSSLDTLATVTGVATNNVFSGIPTTTCSAASIGNADSNTVRACADATRAANCAISSAGVVSCGVPDTAALSAAPLHSEVGGTWVKGKVNLTQPATGSTITITDGKTLSVSNTLTFLGTDGTTFTLPATNAVAARTDAGQTFVGGQLFTGTLDASGAAHSLPFKTGVAASKPGTCTVGELYFATDATAGQNAYFCTATNTWTQQLNSGGGGGTGCVPAGSSGQMLSDSGSGTCNSSSTLTTTTIVYLTGTQTLTNKRINPRIDNQSGSATTYTPNGDSFDVIEMITSTSTGFTWVAPSGTPVDGQKLILKMQCTNAAAQAITWPAGIVGGNDVALPTLCTGNSKIDQFGMLYDTINSKWELVAVARGY